MISRLPALAAALTVAAVSSLHAQRSPSPQRGVAQAGTPVARPADTTAEPSLLRHLRWRSVGPANNAGRVSVVAGVPGNRDVYYVAGANGGIIKTTNGGTTFRPIFDKQPVGSIGAIAIAPSDPNIIYVGTGEENPRNNASIGNGMYKSVDAGEHWTHIGLDRSERIARIVVDSRNPDIVYACGLGREWGPNDERGVFKTTDGGTSWKRILFVDPQTACSDIAADPGNSNVLYAGMYTYRRWAWHLESGGGNTAVYRSTDGGATWERLSGKDRERGLPKGDMDRIGIAVAASDPAVVYVVSETKSEGELWRSDDGGDHWRVVNRDPNINFRPFYYSDIRVDPQNPNRVFSLSGSLYMSEDGGTTFRTIARDVHGDHQALWIDPTNPKYILSGSDGGWQVSYDGGRNFEVVNNFPFTQFYHINFDMQKPYMTCGGLQDNGNWCGPSQTLSGQGNRKTDWFTVSGGDGFFTVPVMDKPWLVYSDAQGGMLNLTDTRTGTQAQIYPYPNRVGSVGDAMLSHKYRFNWNSPIALSPINPQVVYFGGNVLFKSTDYGHSWQVVSPDLTTNDPKKLGNSGGPIVVDNTAAEFHCTIISIAPSPLDSNVIWVGTDDGNVQVTRDGGKTWSNVFVNVPGLKPNAWIPTVDASHADPGTAYVAADHHQDDDYTPYAYMTSDYGKTWKRITGDLPISAAWVHVVREDPRNHNLLYLGSEMGVWASWDRGVHWVSLKGDLPVVPVRDVQVHPRDNDLLLATHGRGLYILDDVSALQNLTTAQATDATLFDIRPATRWSMWSRDGNLGQKKWTGENPPNGALITYYLREQPAGEVNITVTDKDGRMVRRMRRVSDDAGINRVAWDLRYDAPPGLAGGGRGGRGGGAGAGAPSAGADTSLAALRARRAAAEQEDEPPQAEEGFGGRGGGAGLEALPGTYTVTLSVSGKQYTKPVQVALDPRSDMTPAQLTAQFETATELNGLAARVSRIVSNTDDLLQQLTSLQDQLRRANRGAAGQGVVQQSQSVLADIGSAIGDLRHFRDSVLARPLPGLGYRQYPRLREEVQSVSSMVSRPMMPPTAGELLRAGELKTEADEAQARLDSIIQNRIVKINQALTGTPHVITTSPPQRIVP
ncbi:MAG TPA: hypothetical protein VL549_04535 [Gemmatimonadales bacterium]|nr:hypothetical protein [Gemmatimonadales bacterium]